VNVGSTANKIAIEKVDKVGIEKDDFGLLLGFFEIVRIDGNGLFIVPSQDNSILFHWVNSSFSF
jgi:hypothetical protein